MCGAILRPFNSISDISCRWEGGIEMCVIAPVYSMEDCRLQLIPGTARLNLLSYRKSNSFQTWPCRYNYVHLIQCDHTHNLIHLLGLLPLLLSIKSQLVIRKLASCYFELASRYYELASRYNELASRYNELVSRYYELASRYYELAARYNELASRHNELASRYNELASCYYELVSRYYELVSHYNELFSRYNKQ